MAVKAYNAAHLQSKFRTHRINNKGFVQFFNDATAFFLSLLQGKWITLKSAYIWSNHCSANYLWFERNRANNHGVITKNAKHL